MTKAQTALAALDNAPRRSYISGDKFTLIDAPGLRFIVYIDYDDFHGAPWEEYDGHGPVRSVNRCTDKRPGERLMRSPAGGLYAYDFAEAMARAKRDHWGVANPPPGATPGQIAQLAVEDDFEYLSDWLNDRWNYAIVTVGVLNRYDEPEDEECLGGVEYGLDDANVADTVEELAMQCWAARAHRWREALKEAREVKYWAARDVVTYRTIITRAA